MQILIIRNEADLKRILQHVDKISVCKLVKPFKKNTNSHTEMRHIFSHTEWRYAIHDEKIEGVDSVEYQYSICKRLEFEKCYLNVTR